jgi:hypothetical protein
MKALTLLVLFGLTLTCLLSCKEQSTPPVAGESMKSTSPESDKDFVGLEEKAGAALAEKRTLGFRVVSVDGQLQPTTRDFRPDRINAELEMGIIVKVTRG